MTPGDLMHNGDSGVSIVVEWPCFDAMYNYVRSLDVFELQPDRVRFEAGVYMDERRHAWRANRT